MELQLASYNVVEMSECELLRQIHSNPEIRTFFGTVGIPESINPRKAFFAGHTNAVKLYHKIKNNEDGTPVEKINYMDILKISEVWHYDNVEQYHPIRNPDGGLFTQYINIFMKMVL
uniref:Uncharacterized protein n=1 Tax=Romanomermis culicivorax TaxID=13658 RepID=A0A915JNQ0_ROMCU